MIQPRNRGSSTRQQLRHASLSVTSAAAAAQGDCCETSINQCIEKLQNTTLDSYLVRCFVFQNRKERMWQGQMRLSGIPNGCPWTPEGQASFWTWALWFWIDWNLNSPHIYSVATSAKPAGSVWELLGSRAKPTACLWPTLPLGCRYPHARWPCLSAIDFLQSLSFERSMRERATDKQASYTAPF